MRTQIETIIDFENVIKKIIPGSSTYNNDFKVLYEYISFEELVLKIIPSNKDKTYLFNEIRYWCYEASNELSNQLKIAYEEEEKKRIIEEEKRKKEEFDRRKREQEEKDRKHQEELERLKKIEEENKRRILEIQREIRRYRGG